ncbi:MacB family efflux pump subunit [Bifidobacterium sp. DSM 109958]|uniref:MacB family efflux pump subunit n=1 Tax=Bifidobacterium moraviense TaxID=2675323 RepID=A0A7Y0HXT2_9BIFI|nr:ATP-binding cassette domain-containing protein [Bifidobacterium sp. DSM 109958]NMM99766.1 MacB family efflux pump subunit [Bifidobacterium sp. DSM 109958]
MPVTLSDIRFRYDAHGPYVLDGLDLTIPDGQLIALMGPSGSGKTTLLQIIGGLLRPTGGTADVTASRDETRWVFQTPTLLAHRSVRHNIDIALMGDGWDERSRGARVERMIRDMRLEGLADTDVNLLSGGQRQRVQIARALASEPPLVLADEPTGQLDHATTGVVLDAIRAAHRRGTTIVIVTHDPYVAARCERVVTLEDGRVSSDEPGGHARRGPA